MENLKWEVDQKEREIQSLKQQLDLTEQQSRKELDGTQQLLQVSGLQGLSRKLGGSPQVGTECAQGLQVRGMLPADHLATSSHFRRKGAGGAQSPGPRLG